MPSGGGTYGIFVIGTVDWGDGTSTTSSDRSVQTTHNYAAGTYTVTLSGTDHRVSHYNSSAATNRNWVTKVFTFGTDMSTNAAYMFAGCQYCTDIIGELPNGITNLNYAFQALARLVNFPNPAIPSSVTMLQYAYTDMQRLPIDASLFFTKWTGSETISLATATFAGNTNMTGTVPASKLWENPNITSHNQFFGRCTGLTNYDDIPAGWK